jgi:hypothetical protein
VQTKLCDARDDFDRARVALRDGPAVLRDYTKSMKHYWREAAFIPDLADAGAAWQVAARFRPLRGEDFAGGFVLRRFEEFTGARYARGGSKVTAACARRIRTHPTTALWPTST